MRAFSVAADVMRLTSFPKQSHHARRLSQSLLTSAATLVWALALVSCGHKEGDGHAHSDAQGEAEPGVSFQAKHGLLVPPATAKFIGLQVADVEERKVASALHFAAQVYRPANEAQFASTQPGAAITALASGTVSPTQAALLREGQMLSVAVEGAKALPGRIAGVNRAVEKASGQFEVLLMVTDEQARLAKGVFLAVSVPLGGEKSVMSVPRSALLRTTAGDFVYTASGERFVRAAVKVGMVNHEFAEVTDGLFEGDKIVVNPVMTLWMAELQSLRGGQACADGH